MILRPIFTTLLLAMAACNGLGDLAIPDLPDSAGWQPEPLPLVAGAWDPCDQGEDAPCLGEELACHSPGDSWGGACTWTCTEDSDCSDLVVDEKAFPRCLGGLCQLRCFDFDEECPGGMACSETGEAKICTWSGSGEK